MKIGRTAPEIAESFQAMILNTRLLFGQLLSTLGINVICDIGSMDGSDALAFRALSRGSSIYAFEPNPENFRAMQTDQKLRAGNIQLSAWAVGDRDGPAPFYLVKADHSQVNHQRGMSSLYERSGQHAPHQVVQVQTTRLDSFMSARELDSRSRLALWIDTEGKAFEVMQGSTGIAESIQLLHVEVETVPCIGQTQKVYADVRQLLLQLGFAEVGTDQVTSNMQFNALFIRRHLPIGLLFRAKAQIARARCRRLLLQGLGTLCPKCLRHLRQTFRSRRIQ